MYIILLKTLNVVSDCTKRSLYIVNKTQGDDLYKNRKQLDTNFLKAAIIDGYECVIKQD